MKRRWAAIAVVVAQLALLAYMAGEREWIVRTGRVVLLRTAPIDPNDPMRGQYVRLDYDISVVPRRLCEDGIAAWFDEGTLANRVRDRVVFARLDVAPDGLAELAGLTDREPGEGVFLRGRALSIDGRALRVRYGIEAFFMEQGKARALEDEMRRDVRRGAPLNVEAAVGGNGTAVLRDYAWEPLGITIALERSQAEADPASPGPRARPLAAIRVKLSNYGAEPVAIVDLPGGASFRLIRNERWGGADYRWVGEDRPPPAPGPGDVHVLQPGESRETRLDLARPEWFVVPEAEPAAPGPPAPPVALGSLDRAWNASFRIEYAPPGPEASAGLPHAERIRHRPLRSRAFTPAGAVD